MNLFPDTTVPYFIFTPAWTTRSSGVRALHLLCHALNSVGQRAYLFPSEARFCRNPFLNTPLATDVFNDWDAFQASGLDYVVVYPDIVSGNPLNAKKVVRYLLAPAGAHGGDKSFRATDKVFGYTKDIAEPVLCIPTTDPPIFYSPPAGSARKGSVFYAHKYDRLHGNTLLPLTDKFWRLEGSPQEIADMLREAEVCYVYERTEVQMQAEMCGCHVLPIVTSYWNGAWPEELRADNLPRLQWSFERQLEAFIESTQQWQI